MGERIEGGCLCGACRYGTEARAINVRACYCRTCQKATGGVVYARVLVPFAGLEVSGPVGWHASSSELRRGFCTRCGSTMFSERAEAQVMGLTLGSLDKPEAFQPGDHIWTSCKPNWVLLDDKRPEYREGPV